VTHHGLTRRACDLTQPLPERLDQPQTCQNPGSLLIDPCRARFRLWPSTAPTSTRARISMSGAARQPEDRPDSTSSAAWVHLVLPPGSARKPSDNGSDRRYIADQNRPTRRESGSPPSGTEGGYRRLGLSARGRILESRMPADLRHGARNSYTVLVQKILRIEN
jgi:hypothetical protein